MQQIEDLRNRVLKFFLKERAVKCLEPTNAPVTIALSLSDK